jgi:hypothetical protein
MSRARTVNGRGSIRAGVEYATIVFVVGFALGTVRVLLLAPRVGELAAVALEAPLMLLVSWMVCAWTIRRDGIPSAPAARALMGGVALVSLLSLELVVSVAVFGRTVTAHFASYAAPAALLGLAAQLLFACFPLVQDRRTQLDA